MLGRAGRILQPSKQQDYLTCLEVTERRLAMADPTVQAMQILGVLVMAIAILAAATPTATATTATATTEEDTGKEAAMLVTAPPILVTAPQHTVHVQAGTHRFLVVVKVGMDTAVRATITPNVDMAVATTADRRRQPPHQFR